MGGKAITQLPIVLPCNSSLFFFPFRRVVIRSLIFPSFHVRYVSFSLISHDSLLFTASDCNITQSALLTSFPRRRERLAGPRTSC